MPETLQAFIERTFAVDRTPQLTTPRVAYSSVSNVLRLTKPWGDTDIYESATWVIQVHSHPKWLYVQISFKDAEGVTAADGQGLLAVIAECRTHGIDYNTYYDGDFEALTQRWSGVLRAGEVPGHPSTMSIRRIPGSPPGAPLPPFPVW